jgi:hypothetical protein
MILASKMAEVSTMTTPMTKGDTKEEDTVCRPVATAVAAYPNPPPPCVPHMLPLPRGDMGGGVGSGVGSGVFDGNAEEDQFLKPLSDCQNLNKI